MDKEQIATEAHYNRFREQIRREYGEKDLKMMESIALTLCKQKCKYDYIPLRLHYMREIVSKLRMKNKKLNIHTLVNDNRPNLYCYRLK